MIHLVKAKLLASPRLITNLLWNFSGQILPLFTALICIPILLANLGEERFGFLAIAWVVIGYFSLFDFGLGRSLTYIVAKKKAEKNCPLSVINTALKFLFCISIVILMLFYAFSGLLVGNVLNVSVNLSDEATKAIKVLSLGLPFVIMTIGLRGVLEAYGLFKKISLITIPSGILLFALPAAVSYHSDSLIIIFLSLVLIRLGQFLLFFINVKGLATLNIKNRFNIPDLKELLTFGGWMTVTNIVSPIMVNMDRFFIGAKVSVSSVTNYVVPFDLITKALVLPSAISGVLFPEFATRLAAGRMQDAKELLLNSILALAVFFFIPLSFFYVFADDILTIWISSEFALQSSEILKILCIGVFFNGLAYLPFAFIQGAGRSDITAKLHVVELILYLPLLIYMIDNFGITGAAYAWSARVFIDLLLMSFFCVKKSS